MRALTAIPLALVALAGLSGCTLGDEPSKPPQLGAKSDDKEAAVKLGFPSTATKNTVRVGGGDAAADAAGVASLNYPGTDDASRPTAVVLVDKDDWQSGVAASVLAAAPIKAPLLVSDGGDLPAVTKDTLDRLKPKGSDLAKDAQVIRIGPKPKAVEGLKNAVIPGADPYTRAEKIDAFFSAAKGKPSRDVLVVSGERPEYAMPAAPWAAFSGDAVLMVKRDGVPAPTQRALRAHSRPNIFVLGPKGAISEKAAKDLERFGKVRRIAGPTPVESAIAFARYDSEGFGWGYTNAGNVYTLASTGRPLDAAASAAFASRGVPSALLLTDDAAKLPKKLEFALLNVQPGYEDDPRTVAYSRAWVLGDEKSVSVEQQAQLDRVMDVVPIEANAP